MGRILLRGMLCGIIAGLLAFAFAHQFGEPQIAKAIAFETRERIASGKPADPEIFSRAVQSGVGLFTAVLAVGTALGGLFAIAFAFAYGRIGALGPRTTAATLAVLAFVSVDLAPSLKYPANPPSVGNPATLDFRTDVFFSMIAISVAAMLVAIVLASSLAKRIGAWNAIIAAGIAYVAIVAIAQAILPGIDEVPAAFSAVLLYQFRVASIGTFAILWATIGLLFGYLTERSARPARASFAAVRTQKT